MNKLAAVTLLLILLGTNAFSMPLVFVESDIYAVEIESELRSDTNAAQSENLPSEEVEERQEESAVLTQMNGYPSKSYTLHFLNQADEILTGALPDLVIPPNN